MNLKKSNGNVTYRRARLALLLMSVFTAVNLLMLLSNSTETVLFSAALPHALASAAYVMYDWGMPLYLVLILAVVTVLLLAAYVLCWWLSKTRGGWLLTALLLYAVDVLVLLYLVATSFVQAATAHTLPDLVSTGVWVVLQGVVLFYLIRGVLVWRRQKKAAKESV